MTRESKYLGGAAAGAVRPLGLRPRLLHVASGAGGTALPGALSGEATEFIGEISQRQFGRSLENRPV